MSWPWEAMDGGDQITRFGGSEAFERDSGNRAEVQIEVVECGVVLNTRAGCTWTCSRTRPPQCSVLPKIISTLSKSRLQEQQAVLEGCTGRHCTAIDITNLVVEKLQL